MCPVIYTCLYQVVRIHAIFLILAHFFSFYNRHLIVFLAHGIGYSQQQQQHESLFILLICVNIWFFRIFSTYYRFLKFWICWKFLDDAIFYVYINCKKTSFVFSNCVEKQNRQNKNAYDRWVMFQVSRRSFFNNINR